MTPEWSTNPASNYFDPFAAYRESLKGLEVKQDGLTEEQRLCYELFIMNEDGKKLWEILKERHIVGKTVDPTHPQGANMSLYFEGYRAALRGLMDMAVHHRERIAHAKRSD